MITTELLFHIHSFIAIAIKLYFYMHIGAIILNWMHARNDNVFTTFIYRYTYPLWQYFYYKLPQSIKLYYVLVCLLFLIFLELFLPKAFFLLSQFFFLDSSFYSTSINLIYVFIASILEIVSTLTGLVVFCSLILFIANLTNTLQNTIIQYIYAYVSPIIQIIEKRVISSRNSLTQAIILLCISLFLYFLVNYLQSNLAVVFNFFISN